MFNQYVLILVWVGFMALIQGSFYREKYNELTGEWNWRVTTGFAFIAFFPVIWMAGTRGWDPYFDTGMYIRGFWSLPNTFSGAVALFHSEGKDPGFGFLGVIIKMLFGGDYNNYLFTLACIQGIAVFTLFRKYSLNYVLSIFLFVASTDYVQWMFNGIRQFTAVAFIILATPLMMKKKYIPACLIIMAASTCHRSALLMIPLVIICQGKAWNKRTLLFIAMAIVIMLFTSRFTSFLDDSLQNTQYQNVVSDYTSWNDNGTNPLRVLVYSIPAIISFYLRHEIRSDNDVCLNFCTNMSIISMGLYLVSMVTSGIFMGRLPIYASLYSYILLPWEMNKLAERGYSFLKSLMIIGYLGFYFLLMRYQNGMI